MPNPVIVDPPPARDRDPYPTERDRADQADPKPIKVRWTRTRTR